jgi:dihydrofolate reductase
MRDIIYGLNVSLDGYIEDANGTLEWSVPDEELHRYFNDLEKEIDVHLYGRGLYEIMAGYWPTAHTDPSAPDFVIEYAHIWQNIPMIVFSRTLEEVGENARLVRGNIAEEVKKLKAQPGKSMVVGGASLAASFMQLDLIDEYQLLIHPVILGGGKPMFGAADVKINLQLVETRRFESGIVLLRYRRPTTTDK